MEEGGHGSLHNHPSSEHAIIVISGKLEVKNDKESHTLTDGMAILLIGRIS